MPLPENFHSLHRHEEAIRQESVSALEADKDLSLHAEALEAAMNSLDHFTRGYPTTEQDALIVQLLGIRLFNGAASALKLLLSGYYQTSASLMRDTLETANLIDYFTIDPSLITQWRTVDDAERWKRFKPVVVRGALGKRDGEKTKKGRDEAYKVFSTFASHPSPKGFRMLRRDPSGSALIGPFWELTILKALFTECAKAVVPARHVMGHFEYRSRLDHLTAIGYLEMSDRWSAHFFGTPYDPAKFVELRTQASKLPPDA